MRNKQKNGFTLVELLIAMVVGLTILLAISSMMDIGLKSSSGVGRRVLTQQDARAVLDFMAMEIGMASLNPIMDNSATGIWSKSAWKTSDNTACAIAGVTGVPSPFVVARRGIQIATANSILVAMDLSGEGNEPDNAIGGKRSDNTAIENEYIRYNYNYDATNGGTIKRAVSCGTAETILGGTGSSTNVRNDDQLNPFTGAKPMPMFQYFNVAGTDISASVIATPDAAVNGGGIRDIRRIRINIIADVETQQGSAFRTTRRTYSTDVLVRNHAM